jgi:uncharacterized protein YjbI with pentapeptide repeats
MPNPKHVAKLRASVDAWNAWRSAPASRTETPDLEGANLVGANLRKANLAGAKLRGSDLTEAELFGVDLSGSDLRKAKLTGAILTDAILRGANASEADLSGADLRSADLSGANLILTDLSAANLTVADLRAASLSGASLEGCRLSGSNLGEAGLFGCNLGGSDLEACNLDGADLGEADLRGSRLVQTSLVRTGLGGADFRGAVAAGCSFGANDLSRCKGLDQITHLGPSSVATTTLMLTAEGLGADETRRAEIEVFLRGCGLEEPWLRQFGELIGHPAEFHACFVRYADADQAFARRLHDALQARGVRCWLGGRGTEGGQAVVGRTQANRLTSAKVILCCSASSLQSAWIGKEVDELVEEERRLLKQTRAKQVVMIPVLVDDAIARWENPRVATIRERVGADFAGCERPDRFDEQLGRLVRQLASAPGLRNPAASPPQRDAESLSA